LIAQVPALYADGAQLKAKEKPMQNTTSLQPSNHNIIPKHVKIVLNTGFTYISEQSQCLKPESLGCTRNIIYRETALIPLSFGQIKFESRRRGAFLDCAFSYNNAQLCACAVSGQGLNRQFWDELITHYSYLLKMKGVLGCSVNTLKAPEHSPWTASFMYSAICLIKKQDVPQLLVLMNDIAVAFMIDSAISSGAEPGLGSR